MQYPLVSAIVLCYNHARFVVECLESVKAQNYSNLELIINDDASNDNSVSVIEAWLSANDIPYKFLKNKVNLGLCRSLNNALKNAHGKYFSGIAADDVWLPGKLATQVRLMEELPEKVGVIYSDAFQMDENGKLLPDNFIKAHRGFETMPAGNIQQVLWEGNFIPAMTTMTRRECVERVGLYDETLFYEDWDMWLRIAKHYNFFYSEQVSAKYRLVGTSMVRSQWPRLVDAMCQMCVKHLNDRQLDPVLRSMAAIKLHDFAAISFEQKSPGHKNNLIHAMKHCPTLGILTRWLLANCGVGSERFDAMRSVFRGRRSPQSGKP